MEEQVPWKKYDQREYDCQQGFGFHRKGPLGKCFFSQRAQLRCLKHTIVPNLFPGNKLTDR